MKEMGKMEKYIKENLNRYLPEELHGEVFFEDVAKNNVTLRGVSVRKKKTSEMEFSTIVYLNNYYNRKMSFEEICCDIANEMVKHRSDVSGIANNVSDSMITREGILKHCIYVLCSSNDSRHDLYRQVGDLHLALGIVFNAGLQTARIFVDSKMLKKANVTEEEAWDAAEKNSYESAWIRIETDNQMLQAVNLKNIDDSALNFDSQQGIVCCKVSNHEGLFGGGEVFNKQILEKLYRLHGGAFWILPNQVDYAVTLKMDKKATIQVAQAGVVYYLRNCDETDFVTPSVYYYTKEKGVKKVG